MKKILSMFVCATFTFALTGCGGGSTTSPAATGRLTLSVTWPKKSATSTTRLIPIGSQSIVAVVTRGSQTLGTQIIVGADGAPGPSTVTFTGLPAGTVTLTASAYPTQQGTGVAMATGSQPATIFSGQNTNVSVTMASTIDHVTITPVNPTVAVGSFVSLTMNAFDAQGNMVLAALTADFVSVNTGTATVATGGNPSVIKGIATGTSLITVTERESGKTASTTVTVFGVVGEGTQ